MSSPPLQGLLGLDLSNVLAGPLYAHYLGDMGAEVIKVETPEAGDETRNWPHLREVEGKRIGATFLNANRNKCSLVINLQSAKGRKAIHKLASSCDMVITG